MAYDGAAFRGFALQPEVPTVAGALRAALGRTARLTEPPALTCAGRTDAGVHARGQVVHVDLPPVPFDGVGLARALNRQLAPSIVVLSATEVPDEFDARRSATGRRYRYLVWNAPVARPACCTPSAGTSATRWICAPWPCGGRRACWAPTTSAPSAGASPATSPDEPIVRRVTQARWSLDGGGPRSTDAAAHGEGRLLRFEIEANSFCHQMVRSVVGSLVEVGRGRGNAATLLRTAAVRHPPPGRRSGPGSGALPGLGPVRLGRWPGRPSAAVAGTGGLPEALRGPILVRRPTGPPRT